MCRLFLVRLERILAGRRHINCIWGDVELNGQISARNKLNSWPTRPYMFLEATTFIVIVAPLHFSILTVLHTY